jgi:hypothetical protein
MIYLGIFYLLGVVVSLAIYYVSYRAFCVPNIKDFAMIAVTSVFSWYTLLLWSLTGSYQNLRNDINENRHYGGTWYYTSQVLKAKGDEAVKSAIKQFDLDMKRVNARITRYG